MRFDLPAVIHTKPRKNDWLEFFPDNKMMIKIAHRAAMVVYWRTVLSESQNHRCCWCGTHMTEFRGKHNSETIEHLIPKSKGGGHHPDNYAVSCSKCNNQRGDKSVEEFMTVNIPTSKKLRPHMEQYQELCNYGLVPHTSSKPCKIKRKIDQLAAMKAIQSASSNPFELGTRSWKLFERYASSPDALEFLLTTQSDSNRKKGNKNVV